MLAPNLHLEPISQDSPLPPGMKKAVKAEATSKGALRLSDDDDAAILEEASRRVALEHEEAFGEDCVCDDSDEDDNDEIEEEGDEDGVGELGEGEGEGE